MRGRYVIAGIGHTAYGKTPGRTPLSLCVESVREALKDAGLDKSDVDGVFAKDPSSAHGTLFAQTVSDALGLQPRVGVVVDQGGASMATMVGMAAQAIDAGQCNVAVVVMGDTPRTGSRPYDREWGHDAAFGWSGIVAGYAMLARRHMELFGTTSEQLGSIASTIRGYGAANSDAQLRLPLTVADYLDSQFVVDPLRRDDCCLISDGGAAMVVMSRERAKQLQVHGAVPILGFGQGHTSQSVEQRIKMTRTMAEASAKTAYSMAGVSPSDIDVAQIYDCFTITALVTLESYGFCREGEGGEFCASGALELDGSLPMNTSGGLLAETGMPGGQMIVEAVRQLRGTSSNQANKVDKVIVSGQGGVMHTHSTLILGA